MRPTTRQLLRYGLPLGFMALVAVLLVTQLQEVKWGSVLRLLRGYPDVVLVKAGLLAAASYLVYSLYDLVGRHQVRHGLHHIKVMAICFVSYVFNLNLGAWVGGVAFRYRLYARAGLKPAQTTQVLGLSLLTNWLGYLVLAGGIFMSGAVQLPASWGVGTELLQFIGLLLLAAAIAYLALCAFSTRRSWLLWKQKIVLPSWRVALTQLCLSVTNWLLMGTILFLLLNGQAEFAIVLGVLLLSAIAGVITHIPAGLGVMEAVFLAMLGGFAGKGEILAALLAYRGIYYIAPLLLGTLVYLALEVEGGKKLRRLFATAGSG